jgi:hypothetical protein
VTATAPNPRRRQTIRLVDYRLVAGGARCPHCRRRLRIRRGIRSWRLLRALWMAAVACLLPLFVLLAAVAFLLLPLFALLLLAIGPLNSLVHEPERCALCRGVISVEALASPKGAPPLAPARVIDLQRARRLRR